MQILIATFSKRAYELGCHVKEAWQSADPEAEIDLRVKTRMLPELSFDGDLEAYARERFASLDVLLFICASGIAVRAIAPVLKHKSLDPAVLVMDDTAKYCISLLSGHAGGANFYATFLSQLVGAEPVITTATDREGRFAVDEFARKNGLIVANWKTAKEISVSVLEGKKIGMLSDFPIEGTMPPQVCEYNAEEEMSCVRITNQMIPKEERTGEYLVLVNPNLTLGIGCRKETPFALIEEAVKQFAKEQGFDLRAVSRLVSIDIKQEEPGLLELAKKYHMQFETYSAEELKETPGEFPASEFVESVTGVDNVCARAASMEGNHLLVGKTCYEKVTLALGEQVRRIRF